MKGDSEVMAWMCCQDNNTGSAMQGEVKNKANTGYSMRLQRRFHA